MSRYFIEVAYKGSRYSGFQVQENSATIQSEMEKAFGILHRQPVSMTGSSRTDAGVHALQNYFHFDWDQEIHPHTIYKMNAILPQDIVVKQLYLMPDEAHSRFDASSRIYTYHLHSFKNPFNRDTSFFFPYRLDMDLMHQAAAYVREQNNFFAFAKTNSQVKNFNCRILQSQWKSEGDELVFTIEANRFLRGMVRLVTASIIRVGRHKLGFSEFKKLFEGEMKCGYSVPAHGLFLQRVIYPENYFPAPVLPFTRI